MPRRNSSLFSTILNRQIYGANARRDLAMIRILLEKSGKYKNVWEKSSISPIVYDGNLYFDAFRTCYDVTGMMGKPRVAYRLPKLPLSNKIETLLMFESALDQTTFAAVEGSSCGNGSYCIGLTADNYLKVFDIKSGGTLEEIFLSSCHKFKYLSWETDLQRILIKSTLSPNRAPARGMFRLPRNTQATQALLYLAVLSVSPLKLLCVLPIRKSIFGLDVCNATVTNGLLIVMHSHGKMNFYSFDDILKNNSIPLKLGDHLSHGNNLGLPEVDEFESGVVGTYPIGLPVNVCLLDKPCVLFEAVSHGHELCLGGFPWHYIQSLNYAFQVKSVKDDILIENGTLEVKGMSLEMDKVFFHADLSGRILHIGPSTLCCLKLVPASSHDGSQPKYSLTQQFVLDFSEPKQPLSANPIQTKSGRHVKRVQNSYYGNIEWEILQDVDYDDELDVLVVLYLDQDVQGQLVVGFYDNQTGHALRKLSVTGIVQKLHVHASHHSVAIDRCTLVIISKDEHKFRSIVYSLLPQA